VVVVGRHCKKKIIKRIKSFERKDEVQFVRGSGLAQGGSKMQVG
jgi:hypothetical protein